MVTMHHRSKATLKTVMQWVYTMQTVLAIVEAKKSWPVDKVLVDLEAWSIMGAFIKCP